MKSATLIPVQHFSFFILISVVFSSLFLQADELIPIPRLVYSATAPETKLIPLPNRKGISRYRKEGGQGIGGSGGDISGGGGDISGGGGDISGGGGGDISGGVGGADTKAKKTPRLPVSEALDLLQLRLNEMEQMQRKVTGGDVLSAQGLTGKGIGVAIIDSGIWPGSRAMKNVRLFQDFTSTCAKNKICDGHSHGTMVADLITQQAPDTNLFVLKVLDARNHGSTRTAIKAFKWALDNRKKNNIRIINLSLVSPDYISGAWNEGDDMRELIKKAREAGIFVVVAVGNDALSNIDVLPANSPDAIAVGSVSHHYVENRDLHNISSFTNIGRASTPITERKGFNGTSRSYGLSVDKPDMLAPGHNVVTQLEPDSTLDGTLSDITYYYRQTKAFQLQYYTRMLTLIPDEIDQALVQIEVGTGVPPGDSLMRHMSGRKITTDMALVNGTSFAAPFVSGGLAALLEARPGLSLQNFLDEASLHRNTPFYGDRKGVVDFSKMVLK